MNLYRSSLITVFAKLAVIHAALLLEHLPFDGAQKIAGRLIQQLGIALLTFYSNRSHTSILG